MKRHDPSSHFASRVATGVACVTLLLANGCQSAGGDSSQSGATNWLHCSDDADCEGHSGAECSASGYCERNGERISADESAADDDTSAGDDDTGDDTSAGDDDTGAGNDDTGDDTSDDDTLGDDDTSDDDALGDDDTLSDDDGLDPPVEDDLAADDDVPADDDVSTLDAGGMAGADTGTGGTHAGGAGGTGGSGIGGSAGTSSGGSGSDPALCDAYPVCIVTDLMGSCPNCTDVPGCPEPLCVDSDEACSTFCPTGLCNVIPPPQPPMRLRCDVPGEACGESMCAEGDRCCDRCTGACVNELSGANCPEDNRPSDYSCDINQRPFECGDTTCDAVGTQYCEVFTGGPGITSYTCRDLPESCLGAPSCPCVLDGIGCADDSCTCSIGNESQVIVVPPPAP